MDPYRLAGATFTNLKADTQKLYKVALLGWLQSFFSDHLLEHVLIQGKIGHRLL